MPLPWIVTVLAVVWLGAEGWRLMSRRSDAPVIRQEWLFRTGMLASAAAMPLLIVTTHGMTNRYLADFFPTAVVGMALGPYFVLPALARRPALTAVAGVASVLLLGWSVIVTFALNTRLVF
jgi:hypothetical protein